MFDLGVTDFKISLKEYSLIINLNKQNLIDLLENQKMYQGFLNTKT